MAVAVLGAAAQNCTICPDGSPLNSSVAVPLGDVTCGILQENAFAVNDTECEIYQRNAAWCECPNVEPSCTLCDNGSSPSNPDLIPQGMDATCGEMEYLATIAADDEDCQNLSIHAAECGCPAPFCTLCPDGVPPPETDKELSNGATCGGVAEIAQDVTTEDGCIAIRNYAAASCGCSPEVATSGDPCTTVCPDGSKVSDQDAIVGETTSGAIVTCGDVEAQASIGIQDQQTCNVYAQMGVFACGCTNMLPTPSCSLCEDGSAPPNLLLDVDGKGNTCVEFMAIAAGVQDPAACQAFQATAGVYCGCPDNNPVSSASACRLCRYGRLLDDPARIADPLAEIPCSEAEYVANLGDDNVCERMQNAFYDTCCGPELISPYDEGLSYSDDEYIDATLPPAFRPGGSYFDDESDDTNSSASGFSGCLSFVGVLLVTGVILC